MMQCAYVCVCTWGMCVYMGYVCGVCVCNLVCVYTWCVWMCVCTHGVTCVRIIWLLRRLLRGQDRRHWVGNLRLPTLSSEAGM